MLHFLAILNLSSSAHRTLHKPTSPLHKNLDTFARMAQLAHAEASQCNTIHIFTSRRVAQCVFGAFTSPRCTRVCSPTVNSGMGNLTRWVWYRQGPRLTLGSPKASGLGNLTRYGSATLSLCSD